MEFDRFDARILSALQRDGRLSVVELAESIGLSPTPCARRIKALESSGVIEGYAAILNPTRVGLGVLAIVQVKLTEHTDETRGEVRKRNRADGRSHQMPGDDRQLRLHSGSLWQGFGRTQQCGAEENSFACPTFATCNPAWCCRRSSGRRGFRWTLGSMKAPSGWFIACCLFSVYVIWGHYLPRHQKSASKALTIFPDRHALRGRGRPATGLAGASRPPMPPAKQWRGAILIGFLLLVVGTAEWQSRNIG